MSQKDGEEKWASLKKRLDSLSTDAASRDEKNAALTCALAYEAARQGNFGVGGVLIDPSGEVVAQGHNEVFFPRFRSDRHAEMVVMDRFEEEHPSVKAMKGYTLYTSLEPCPMCLTRLITAGVGTIKWVADDLPGGMARLLEQLPSLWTELVERQAFVNADVTETMRTLAFDIYNSTAKDLEQLLIQRRK